MSKFIYAIRKFRSDGNGAVLTEYLVLLGLVIGGAALAATSFAAELSTAFDAIGAHVAGMGPA